jgi:transcriptional regulator with XRE-family HTH domain
VEPAEQFALNLRRARDVAGLSQEELSDRSGLHSTEISRLERGVREPRLGTIVRIARGLGVAPADLLTDIR